MAGEKIPPLRLAQIAEKRLAALGLPSRIHEDVMEARGVITFTAGVVLDPITRVKVAEAPFRSVGHDKLEFLEAPLAGLGSIPFFDAPTMVAFEHRVAQALGERLQALQEATRRFQGIRIEPTFDIQRLLMVTVIDTPARQYELAAVGPNLRVSRVRAPKGSFIPLPEGVGELKFEEFMTRSDVELHLTSQGDVLQAASEKARSASGAEVLESLPPPPGAVTVEMLQRFGPMVSVRAQDGRLYVSRDFRYHEVHYRFEAAHDGGVTFKGRFGSATSEKWSDKFDLTRFPGIEPMVRIVLGLPEVSAQASAPAIETREAPPAPSADAFTSSRSDLPIPGELWVMNVIVERESGNEVRYVCTNVDGQPYGAQRVLSKDDFPKVFTPYGTAWRLRVKIDAVEGEQVVYTQVDAEARPRSAQRRVPLAIFTTTFVPEAAAY